MQGHDIIGNYLVEREIGRGGMGVVYAATHRVLGKPAAIKVLLTDARRHSIQIERFFNEARAAMAIRHPGIVEVYDVGIAADSRPYLAMELLGGGTLTSCLAHQPLRLRLAVEYARQIADALAAAHDAGIVHRDLKPDNIFVVAANNRIKLVDFGVAKLANAINVRTATGALIGTPACMSPEQCEGLREIDARADLYALGCVMFTMLTGAPPFDVSGGTAGLIDSHLHVAPPLLRTRCPEASEALEAVVQRLLAKSRDARFRDARELLAALSRHDVGHLASRPNVAVTADTPPAELLTVDDASRRWTYPLPPTPPPLVVPPPPPTSMARSRRTRPLMLALLGCAASAAIAIALTHSCAGASTPPVIATRDDAAPIPHISEPPPESSVRPTGWIDRRDVEALLAIDAGSIDARPTDAAAIASRRPPLDARVAAHVVAHVVAVEQPAEAPIDAAAAVEPDAAAPRVVEAPPASIHLRVEFESNSIVPVDRSVTAQIDQAAQVLVADRSLRLQITGHAEQQEGARSATTLAEARGKALKRQFIQRGVEPNRITVLTWIGAADGSHRAAIASLVAGSPRAQER